MTSNNHARLSLLEGARVGLRSAALVTTTLGLLGPLAAERTARKLGGADVYAAQARWVRIWAKSLLREFGIEVFVVPPARKPAEPVDAAKVATGKAGTLVVSNHRSAIDIGVLLSLFTGHMVSRADLGTWPLIGLAARTVGTVFVDRQSRASGAEVVRMIESLLRDGKTVIIFPEGTTFEGDEVRAFRGGAFTAAERAGATIVPVGIAYASGSGAAFVQGTFLAHLKRIAASPKTRVAVAIGAPRSASGRHESRQETWNAVNALVSQARATVDQPPPTK